MGVRAGSKARKDDGSLAARFPQLVAEWHPTANAPLTPRTVKPSSGKRVTWVCRTDPAHVWEARVGNRTSTNKTGCPYCAGLRITPATSLAALYPEVASEWHPTANGALRASEVAGKAKRKVWWKCRADPMHVWEAAISHRTASGTGCPVCAGKVVIRETSLRFLYPRLAREWHPDKNGEARPDDVGPGCSLKVWWRCRRDPTHEWLATPASRTTRARGCPACAHKVVTPKTSLATLFPDFAREWHPTRNGDLTPDDVTAHSDRKVFWQCLRDPTHAWPAAIDNRTRQGDGCPICSNKRVTPATSLAARFPDLAGEWHPTKNGSRRPDDVVPGSGARVWWRCAKDPAHVWRALVLDRAVLGRGCPGCRTLLAKRPDLAREWHPTRNGRLTPADVSAGSSRKRVWWRCALNPAHEWRSSPAERGAGRGCPDCGRENRRRRSLRGTERAAPDRALRARR